MTSDQFSINKNLLNSAEFMFLDCDVGELTRTNSRNITLSYNNYLIRSSKPGT